jgi:hypothetical protein
MTLTKNGVSTTTAKGQEQYEYFSSPVLKGKRFCQYDYRHTNGQLFSCVKPTLEQCRISRNRWLINERLRTRQTEILLAMQGTVDQDPDSMIGLSNELDSIVFTANN